MLPQDTEKDIPEGFLKRMRDELKEEYPEFLESLRKKEQKALRINPLSGFLHFGEGTVFEWRLEEIPWEKGGFYYDAEDSKVTPGKHPLHEAGAYYIQEASAMYPVNMLDPKPGERVLDLCAAPGGKSAQIAARMENTGLLISNEIIPSRAAVLSSNIERMGIRNAVVTNMDPGGISRSFPAFFDRILVDAPCSGEGMIRRGDAARENWSEENVGMCALRQMDILGEAAKCLRPGGHLVYSTCTFSKEEDEDNVRRFLEDHSDYELVEVKKLYPHKIRGEGHFAALFIRKGSENLSLTGINTGIDGSIKKKKNKSDKDAASAVEALKDFLTEEAWGIVERGRVIVFSQNLYLLPDGIDGIDRIKTLRPGLCLGIMKKGRFEPSHSLAASLRKGEAKRQYDVDSKSRDAYDYLSGQMLLLDEKSAKTISDGWCVVSFDGVSAGLGKKTGKVIKNHYPKGLRINI